MGIHKCNECEAIMLQASSYDPNGEIPLYGGYKEHNEQGELKEWWVCINPVCKEGKQNISP